MLALEPLAIRFRASLDVKGIDCGGIEHKCILFADDLLMAISSPITTLPNLYAILKPFSTISGLKINHDKSQAMNISLEDSVLSTLKRSYKFR